MTRYQQAISALLVLCSAFGLLGIGRAILVDKDSITWVSFGLMFALAWAARRMIVRMPIAAEASMRLGNAPTWGQLSRTRRRFLLLFDWPLFVKVREREVRRLFDEPLVSLRFDADSVILRPVEALHSDLYFLKRIARAASTYGLEVSNSTQGVFGTQLVPSQVNLRWCGSDRRIWDHLRDGLQSGVSVS